jgi:hypothetical protein
MTPNSTGILEIRRRMMNRVIRVGHPLRAMAEGG